VSSVSEHVTCPPVETLAAFVDGKLAGDEIDAVIEHLFTCDRCEAIVSATMRTVDATLDAPAVRRPSRMRAATPAVAAVVSLIAVGVAVWWQRSPMRTLINAAQRLQHRPIEARVSGFPWKPYESTRFASSANEDPEITEFRGAAAGVVRRTRDSHGVEAQRANALASLFGAEEEPAIKRLEALTASEPGDARLWNDLAAARLALARHAKDPQEAASALPAAERALSLAPKMPEALFNRALALETLGALPQAHEAWRQYLVIDHSSPWAADAQRHLESTSIVSHDATWQTVKPQLEKAAANNDRDAMSMLVRENSQDARAYGEWWYLDQWAEAYLRGDSPAADAALNAALRIGEALRNTSGESLLRDAAIAAGSAKGETAKRLARAQQTYFEARKVFGVRHVEASLPLFQSTIPDFAAASSPMRLVAQYYVAQALGDSGRTREAIKVIGAISVPPEYKSLRAQIAWERGTLFGSMGGLSEALAGYGSAASQFEAIGETDNANQMRGMLMSMLATMGKSREAWRVRSAIFRSMSERGYTARLEIALNIAARTEAVNGRWDVAASLYSLLVDGHDRAKNPRVLADATLWRALALNSVGRVAEAVSGIGAARIAAARIADRSLRDAAMGVFRLAEGILLRDTDPVRAAALLSKYITAARERTDLYLLPEALREHARALRKTGHRKEAEEELQSAIGLFEERRSSIGDDALRDAYFGGAAETLRELIDLLDERHDRAGVFAVAEQAYGRVLLDRFAGVRAKPVSLAEAQRELPAGTRVLQYVSLPDRLIIQTTTRTSCDSVSVPVTRKQLEEDVEAFLESLGEHRDEPDARRASKHLYDVLVAPVAPRLAGGETLLIIPDGPIQRVSFAALNDGVQFLIERNAILSAPSTSVYLQCQRLAAPTAFDGGVLAVGDPAFDAKRFPRLEPLPEAAREADDLSRLYSHARVLTGEQATKTVVMSYAPAFSIIDIACHTFDGDAGETKLVLTPSADNDGLLSMKEIASATLPRAHVVVLAGCRTADARADAGTINNLAVAFLNAGAANTIGSLIKVDDSATRYFSRQLHRRLRNGIAPVDAIRAAQLQMLHSSDPSRSSLHAWGGFVLYGAGR